MIPQTRTLERTDLTMVEDLDWEFDPSCELNYHPDGIYGHDGGPAWALIQVLCRGCGFNRYAYVCKGRWDFMHTEDNASPVVCGCGQQGSIHEFWRFVALVRP